MRLAPPPRPMYHGAMKALLLLLALLLPSLAFAVDSKQIDGWIVQTLETEIILQVSQEFTVRDGSGVKIKAGDSIALRFPEGSPVFADKTRIRTIISPMGVLTKYTAVDGSVRIIYSFGLLDNHLPRVLK